MAADGRASVKLRASNSTVPAFDSVMQTVDLLLAPRWLIPIEPEGVVLEGHALVADGGRIVAVLPLSEARLRAPPRPTTESPQHALGSATPTTELTSRMRTSYAVFSLKKKN